MPEKRNNNYSEDRQTMSQPSARRLVDLLRRCGRNLLDRYVLFNLNVLRGRLDVVDAAAERDHVVDALRERCQLVQHEARGEERGLEEEEREIAHALVGLVLCDLLPELLG